MTFRARAWLLWPVAVSLLLGGCGIFGGKDEPIEPPAELTEFDAVLTVRKAWDVRIGRGSEQLNLAMRPAVEGGRVYAVGRDGVLHALDLETGAVVWKVDTELRVSAGPAVGHGLAVVGTSTGILAAFDLADGSERWRTNLSGEILAPPAIAPTTVVVRTVDGKLRALRADTGIESWMIEQRPPRLSLRGTAGPAIVGDVVVAGFDDGRIGAYALRDGERIWENTLSFGRGRTEIERLADVDATPQVVGQDVYVVSYRGRLVSIAAATGELLWAQEISSYSGLNVDWTTVYVTDEESVVVALNRSSGAQLWRQDALRMRTLTAPAAIGNSVVLGDFEGWLHWLDAVTGTLQARYRAGKAAFITRPVASGDLLLVQDEADRLYALRAEPRG